MSSAVFDELQLLLGASKSVLVALTGRPQLAKVSTSEKSRFSMALSRRGSVLSVEDTHRLILAIRDVGFQLHDQDDLLDELAALLFSVPAAAEEKVGNFADKKQRQDLQNYEILLFFLDRIRLARPRSWKSGTSPQTPPQAWPEKSK